MASKNWIIIHKTKQPALRLFCFPYAGGGASLFRTWPPLLPSQVEVCAVQLPGREDRISEQPFTSLSALVETLLPILVPYLDLPFAFFGHSLGAFISFELAGLLSRQFSLNPSGLLVSACRAPQLPNHQPPIHALPDDQFIEELRHLGGIPNEVLHNQEIMELFTPLLRADFTLFETYVYRQHAQLSCPIFAFGGQQDIEATYEELAAWKEQTRSTFSLRLFAGNHFFIQSMRADLLHEISKVLMLLIQQAEY